MVEEGRGSLTESVCTSGVDSHHRLAEGRELSGEGDRAWLAHRAEMGGLALDRVRQASLLEILGMIKK